jgi:hypothetical protein
MTAAASGAARGEPGKSAWRGRGCRCGAAQRLNEPDAALDNAVHGEVVHTARQAGG